ncbi:acyltransferase [Aliidongia dinghuensis]|uniref:Acyltransferase n=1 Tax=Aliidongia dinghuensis TaxID=1867774 RepID=A0A8J3E2E8_9PROT|nr:acyltransferase [Aliidongia dinghuensis]
MWRFGQYLQTAVMLFFVLSGFVIAYVLDCREHDAAVYVRKRLARLYSVVLPALLLTAVCDAIGQHHNPDLYFEGPWSYPRDGQPLHYISTLFLLNQTWLAPNMEPGINTPFWSLSFEAFYYALIGLAVFASGSFRALSILLVSLLAGPAVLGLFPIWLLGFGLYHLSRRWVLPAFPGALAAVLGLVLLLSSPMLRASLPNLASDLVHREAFIADYVDGLAFALHLYGMMSLERWTSRMLGPWKSPIRWFSSLTFPLYLFHRPLIQLFAAIPIAEPSAWTQRIYLLAGTLLVIVIVGRRCVPWKTSLDRGLRTLQRRVASQSV